MLFRSSNHNTHARTETRCAMCGASIVSNGTRVIDSLCLLCRAAILDRIFQTRARQAQAAQRR